MSGGRLYRSVDGLLHSFSPCMGPHSPDRPSDTKPILRPLCFSVGLPNTPPLCSGASNVGLADPLDVETLDDLHHIFEHCFDASAGAFRIPSLDLNLQLQPHHCPPLRPSTADPTHLALLPNIARFFRRAPRQMFIA